MKALIREDVLAEWLGLAEQIKNNERKVSLWLTSALYPDDYDQRKGDKQPPIHVGKMSPAVFRMYLSAMFSTRKRRGGSGVAVEVGDDVAGGEALEGAHYVSQSHLESARASFVHFYTEYGVKRPDELQS